MRTGHRSCRSSTGHADQVQDTQIKHAKISHVIMSRSHIDHTRMLWVQIEHYDIFYPGVVADGGEGPLKKAQSIIKDLRDRRIYKYINEVCACDCVRVCVCVC